MIAEPAAQQIAAELHADIAIRNQFIRQRALHKARVGVALQALQSQRRLELARSDREPRFKARGDIGILHDGLASGEVRHDAKIHEAAQRAFDDGTHLTQQERVAARSQRRAVRRQ